MTEKEMRELNGMLRRIERSHHMLCERNIAKLGLHRSQHMLLTMLVKQETLPSQKELAKWLGISPAAVAVSLKKLESDGYITRSTALEDSRSRHVLITEKGRHVVEESRKGFFQLDQAMFRGISPEQATALRTSLQTILDNVTEALGKEDSQ